MVQKPETMPIDDGLCAVVDCPARGRPQVCPYDGRYHHHGYIHYQNGHRWHPSLTFRAGAWHGVCDRHYEVIIGAARAARVEG